MFSTLVRLLGDLDLAEEALQDAFVAALESWPQGVPANPRAWLVSAGRFRAIDRLRRLARFSPLPPDAQELLAAPMEDPYEDHSLEDDRLRLVFTCCHPALSPEARIALTLREVCGLTTEEIAAAFLERPPTLAQRIVRAKAKIREARIPYREPSREELPERLDAVLQVVYLIFNEGYYASGTGDLVRRDLTTEALRLCELLSELLPDPEVLSLQALLLFQDSRRAARLDVRGELVLLEDQDRSLWDREAIARAQELTDRAFRTGHVGPYALQAAIASLHATPMRAEDTDWEEIAGLYRVLLRCSPSPVVALNAAVADGMLHGPQTGLRRVREAMAGGDLDAYVPAYAALATFLERCGEPEAARHAWSRALELVPQDSPQRRFFRRKGLERPGCS